jgi:hypothetical protein
MAIFINSLPLGLYSIFISILRATQANLLLMLFAPNAQPDDETLADFMVVFAGLCTTADIFSGLGEGLRASHRRTLSERIGVPGLHARAAEKECRAGIQAYVCQSSAQSRCC